MTTSAPRVRTLQPARPSAVVPNPLRAPFAWLRSVIKGFEVRRQRDTAIAVLHELDHRTLRDIGVDKPKIVSLVYSEDEDQADKDRAA